MQVPGAGRARYAAIFIASGGGVNRGGFVSRRRRDQTRTCPSTPSANGKLATPSTVDSVTSPATYGPL